MHVENEDEGQKDARRNVKDEIEDDMQAMEFVKIDDSFDYLLRLNILSFTEEKLKTLKDEIEKISGHIESLESTLPADMWKDELETFLVEYEKWERSMAY